MSQRSPITALRDARELLESLKIKRAELVSVNVYAWDGDITVNMRPEGFARVFVELGIPRSKVEVKVEELATTNYVRAEFRSRGATFVATKFVDRAQLDALLQSRQPKLPGPKATVITHRQQSLLEHCP